VVWPGCGSCAVLLPLDGRTCGFCHKQHHRPERAVVDMAKLRDYCLNPRHARGRHKAKVFASVLGITQDNPGVLRRALLEAASSAEVKKADKDDYGQRDVLGCEVAGPAGNAMVRSIWIVLRGEGVHDSPAATFSREKAQKKTLDGIGLPQLCLKINPGT
jgi:hypothetical protein